MKSITVESCSRNELVAKQLDSVGGIHCKYFTSPAAPYIGCIQPGTRRKNMSSAKKHDLNESNQALSQKSTTGNSTIVRSKHQTPVSCPTNSGCNKILHHQPDCWNPINHLVMDKPAINWWFLPHEDSGLSGILGGCVTHLSQRSGHRCFPKDGGEKWVERQRTCSGWLLCIDIYIYI